MGSLERSDRFVAGVHGEFLVLFTREGQYRLLGYHTPACSNQVQDHSGGRWGHFCLETPVLDATNGVLRTSRGVLVVGVLTSLLKK
jgi:hypothetical protein